MAFMVKNPGLIPSVSTIWAGEIGRRRDAMFEMFQGYVFSEPYSFPGSSIEGPSISQAVAYPMH